MKQLESCSCSSQSRLRHSSYHSLKHASQSSHSAPLPQRHSSDQLPDLHFPLCFRPSRARRRTASAVGSGQARGLGTSKGCGAHGPSSRISYTLSSVCPGMLVCGAETSPARRRPLSQARAAAERLVILVGETQPRERCACDQASRLRLPIDCAGVRATAHHCVFVRQCPIDVRPQQLSSRQRRRDLGVLLLLAGLPEAGEAELLAFSKSADAEDDTEIEKKARVQAEIKAQCNRHSLVSSIEAVKQMTTGG